MGINRPLKDAVVIFVKNYYDENGAGSSVMLFFVLISSNHKIIRLLH